MELGHVQASRPAYYDRNPAHAEQLYDGLAVAPHAGTSRWTYTVPSGKKAEIEASVLRIHRRTAAAPVGLTQAVVSRDGNTRLRLVTLKNAVGDDVQIVNGFIGFNLAGSLIDFTTADASTGGTVDYMGAMRIVEYDA